MLGHSLPRSVDEIFIIALLSACESGMKKIHDLQSNYDTIKRLDEDAHNATSHSTTSCSDNFDNIYAQIFDACQYSP